MEAGRICSYSPPYGECVSGREIIFEFVQVGNAMKVTAMDPQTLVEVSVVGPATSDRASLRALALRKLEYVLNRRQSGPST
jgi:hypothetical protein